MERVTIFHSNDIHSCFDHWSQMVAHIKKERDEHTLYLDLGDHADRSHPVTEALVGKGNIALLNAAKADYVTIGNNEGVTFSKDQLKSLYDHATFQVLLANVVHADGSKLDWAKPYHIHQMSNGVKIGLIGLTAPFLHFYELLGWKALSPLDVLKEYLPELKKEADIVVLMSHLGLKTDEKIAEEFEGIDVILGAHTHHVLPTGLYINNTLIVQAGKNGAYLGKIEIQYERLTNSIYRKEAVLLDVAKQQTDEQTDNLLSEMKEKANQLLNHPVATLPMKMPVKWQEHTEAGQMLCDAVTEWCGEEIGMLNAGVLLDSLEKGPITKGDIHRILPHPINPCVVTLTGEALEQTIQRSLTKELTHLEVKGFGFRGKVLGKMLFSGIEIDEKNGISILGQPIEKDRLYKVATLDMYTFGFLFPAIAESKDKKYFMPEFLRDVLTWKLKQKWT
ncbi:bifunctional metallophosphatase/5'-nucleotidase [Alkalihalobacillus sp. MEB130]|uniref:bifunctional metallophosphatase/5'-nucleotidase n=1 Tax=Alkalihalobacillus sp. MEB130 TaxID=2976704 RepID=UPI0028DFB110|nr:bifunctional UDP-sugar hydrolase/5'-nucleotidase [Alkalihalobacillus sp. MEB130]MDT8858679.1 bifunctional metallophosphatase/5'-nucleotidase [Alkalihalobacillus sp. MEB130]